MSDQRSSSPSTRTGPLLHLTATANDPRGEKRIVQCSLELCERLGYDRASLIGSPLSRLYPEDRNQGCHHAELRTADGESLQVSGQAVWDAAEVRLTYEVVTESAAEEDSEPSQNGRQSHSGMPPTSAGSQMLELFAAGPLMFVQTVVVGGEVRIDYCNARFATRLGYDREELSGVALADVYSDEAAVALRQGDYDSALDGSFTSEERVLLARDGTEVSTLLRAGPRTDLADAEGTNAVYVDISERLDDERELERHRAILQAVGDPVYALDEDGRFTFVNEAAEEEFGYTATELIGERPSIGISGEDVERVRQHIASLRESTADSATAEIEVTGARGEARVVENKIALVGGDEFRGTAGVLRDVTDRERRREQLESFRQAVEQADDGVAILEGDEYVYIDQTHVDMYGFERKDDLLGETWRELYDQDEVDRLETEAFPALEAKGYWRGRVTGTRPDGSTFPAELSLTIIDDGRLVCTVRDDTQLRERERELQLKERAMDAANVGIQITDPNQPDNPLIYVNDGFERLTGYDESEALGRNPRFLQGEETDDEAVQAVRAGIEHDEPMTTELRNYRADGTPYWARLSVTPVFDETGEVKHYIGIQQDVTERRRQATELTDRTERLEKVLSGTDTALAEIDLETGEMACDETVESVFGYVPETLAEFRAVIHPEDRGSFSEAVQEAAEVDEPRLSEFRVGSSAPYRWLSIRAVRREGDGVTKLLLIGADVTDRRAREEEIRERKERFEQFAATVPNQFFTLDREFSEILYANDAFERLYGVTAEEAEADWSSWYQHVLSPDREAILSALEDLSFEEIEWPMRHEFRVEHPDRGRRWLKTEISPIRDADGYIDRLAGVATDITERKAREQERRALHAATSDLVEARSRAEAVEYAREMLRETLGFDEAAVFFKQGQDMQRALEVPPDEANAITHIERSKTPAWEAYEEDRPVVYDDVEEIDDDIDRSGIQSSAYVPVGEAVLVVGTSDSARLDEEGVRLVETLAGTLQSVFEANVREGQVRESEKRYRTLAENIPKGAVFTFDVDLKCTLAAGELLSTFGIEAETALGRPLSSLLPQEGPDLISEFENAVDGGSADRRIEYEDRTLKVNVVTVEADGEANGLALVQDITEAARREAELSEERERFRLLIESIDDYAFLAVDDDGVITTWTTAAQRLFGYSESAAIGMELAALYPAESLEREIPRRMLEQARITGESAHEGPRVRADGSSFFADVRCAPMEASKRENDGFAVVVRDVTERRKQRRRTERFVEESVDVITVIDDAGEFEYVSGSASQVLDRTPEMLDGQNFFDYLHPTCRERVMKAFFRTVEEPQLTLKEEVRFRTDHRGWLNVEVRGHNLFDDDAIGGVLVYLRDVTDRKQRARRYEAMFDQSYQMSGLLDIDGTVIKANETLCRLADLDRGEVPRVPIWELPLWSHSRSTRQQLRDAVDRAAGDEFVRFETEVVTADGLATVDFSVKPVTDEDGDVVMLIPEGRDITQQKRQRQHLQVLHRVLRHNIRNDLTELEGYISALEELDLTASERTEYREKIRRVLDGWESLTDRVSDIHELVIQLDSNTAHIPVWRAIDRLRVSVEAESPSADFSVDVECDRETGIPATVPQALDELVSNAIEASTDGEPSLDIRVVEPRADWVEISVADDGPGMPAMEAEVLEGGEESPLNHGQGLGLWLVRMLVVERGGELNVETGTDGTVITLRLPVHQSGRVKEVNEFSV